MPGAGVALPDRGVAAEHEDTILHLLDDALVDHRLVVEVNATLTRQCLVGNHPTSQQPG
jgi:hypothetical protein